ncbi:MAG: flagellar export protein FliJ [Peptostreptococcaceae bacterium]|nr:flagellar export protein FliJ [Peptostreptococcaceae bacterium]
MSYKFKLQKILDLKIRQEDDVKMQVAELMRCQRELQAELESLLAEKRAKFRQLEQIRKEGATIQQIRNLTQYNRYIESCIDKAQGSLRRLEADLEEKKAEYMEVRKERKSYENLKEKDMERHRYEEKKQEEKIIDQIVTFQKRGSI